MAASEPDKSRLQRTCQQLCGQQADGLARGPARSSGAYPAECAGGTLSRLRFHSIAWRTRMSKDFSSYLGSLPDSEDEYHVAANGTLRLINFEVNVSALRPQHKQIITGKLVPFLLSGTKSLGPGNYDLRCVGMASATGGFDRNAILSDERAFNAATFAIKQYEAEAAGNPHVATCKLKPVTKPTADTAARQDVIERNIPPRDVERRQAAFRAAQFFLSAVKKHPKGSAIFQIREIYLFKFKSKQEPLPKVLEHIKTVIESKSFLSFFARRIGKLKAVLDRIELFSKTLENALGPEGKLALIILKFMVPEELDSCYEVKNSENNHALYRMNGMGNKMNSGVMDLLGLVAESIAAMKGVVKALKTVLGVPGKFDKTIQTIEKYVTDLHKDAVELARTFGPGFAEVVDVMLTMAENGVTSKAMFAPASPWTAFMFHDRTAKHHVAQLGGPARRNVFGALFNEVVDIEFGGPVPNNWRDYQAAAKYRRLIVDLLEVETVAHGTFFLLKGNYGSDLIVGPTDIVKD
jgi:hypothetical protein